MYSIHTIVTRMSMETNHKAYPQFYCLGNIHIHVDFLSMCVGVFVYHLVHRSLNRRTSPPMMTIRGRNRHRNVRLQNLFLRTFVCLKDNILSEHVLLAHKSLYKHSIHTIVTTFHKVP